MRDTTNTTAEKLADYRHQMHLVGKELREIAQSMKANLRLVQYFHENEEPEAEMFHKDRLVKESLNADLCKTHREGVLKQIAVLEDLVVADLKNLDWGKGFWEVMEKGSTV